MSPELSRSVEIERKYDVDAHTRVPDLADLPGVRRVAQPERRDLDAYYLDTPDGRLAGAATALRRRTGGPDEGWHIKRATPEGKVELHWPLDETADAQAPRVVPAPVLTALAAIAHPPFVPLARVRNARTAFALCDDAGNLVAEFVDDQVTATDLRRDVVTSWREWELELGPAAPAGEAERAALFAAADALFAAAGAHPSASSSKLGRALGA